MTTKFYLIKSDLSESEKESVRAALAIAPPAGTFVFSPEDSEKAKQLSEAPAVTTDTPIAIIANFKTPLVAIDEHGSVEILIEGNEQ